MCRYVWMDCGGACSLGLSQQCCSCIAVQIRYFKKIRNVCSSQKHVIPRQLAAQQMSFSPGYKLIWYTQRSYLSNHREH